MDLLDILFDLLGLAIALVGKFWVLIVMGLSYLLFGKKREPKKAIPTVRPVLAPVENGGYPTPVNEDKPDVLVETGNPFSRSIDTMKLESPERKSATSEVVHVSDELQAIIEHQEQDHLQKSDTVGNNNAVISPREAMKWSIIFSPPRSKMPHSPFHRR